MKKRKVLGLLAMTMVMSAGLTACSGSDIDRQIIESSEENEAVAEPEKEKAEEQKAEEDSTTTQDEEVSTENEAEDAISEEELEEALNASDTSLCQVDHVHQYATQVLKEATCTEDGRMVTSCASCGYVRESVIAATGHEAGEWKVTQLPGRLTEGSRVLSCAKCGEVMGSEAIEPTGASHGSSSEKSTPKKSSSEKSESHTHSYTVGITKDATCTEAGAKVYNCSCGASYVETIAAKGHDFSKTEVEEATCTTEGKVFKECSRCGEKEETAILEKLAHTPGEWKTVKEPSYTELGRREQHCTSCDELLNTEDIAVLPHEHSYQVLEHTDAICEQDGREVTACQICGDVQTEVIPATGHQMTWKTISDATCTASGLKKEICKTCGTEGDAEVIPAIGHQSGDWETTKEPTCEEEGAEHRNCQTCGSELETRTLNALGHHYSDWEVTKEPTDDEAGSRRKVCETCGKEVVEEIQPCEHQYVLTDSKESTCTEAGYDTYTCEECGKSYTEERKLLDHEAGDWETVSEATEAEEGKSVLKCKVCGQVIAEKTIPKLVHTHNYVETDRKDNTCEEDGYVEYTCEKDGDSYRTILKATGHAWKDGETTSATCEKDGKLVKVCENCGEKEETVIQATGHHYVETSRKEATCTAEGSVIRRCENCGDTETEVLEKTAHEYQSTVTEPTCTTDGKITYTCKKCKDTYTEKGKQATGHVAGKWTVIKEAQIGEEGEQVKYCTSCNEIVERQTIPMLQTDGTDSIYTVDIGNGEYKTVIGHMAPQEDLDEMVGYINALRESKGVDPLKLATKEVLVKAGQTRAPELAVKYDHTRPNGTSYDVLFSESKDLEPSCWGENIVMGSDANYHSVKILFDAWVDSQGHYDNMVDGDFKQIVPYSFLERVPGYGWERDENGNLQQVVKYTYKRYFGTIFYTDWYKN